MENIQRDRYQKDISEDRWGDRVWRSYIGMSQKRKMGRQKKRKSRDLSNRSLKLDGETESREPMKGSLQRERWEERKRARAQI